MEKRGRQYGAKRQTAELSEQNRELRQQLTTLSKTARGAERPYIDSRYIPSLDSLFLKRTPATRAKRACASARVNAHSYKNTEFQKAKRALRAKLLSVLNKTVSCASNSRKFRFPRRARSAPYIDSRAHARIVPSKFLITYLHWFPLRGNLYNKYLSVSPSGRHSNSFYLVFSKENSILLNNTRARAARPGGNAITREAVFNPIFELFRQLAELFKQLALLLNLHRFLPIHNSNSFSAEPQNLGDFPPILQNGFTFIVCKFVAVS
jgi:hypothetical protein